MAKLYENEWEDPNHKYYVQMLYENVRLLGSWVGENCEVGVTCGECGRHLTNKEFEEHKEACSVLQNQPSKEK